MELGSAIESSEVAAGVLAFLTQIPADVFDALAPVAQAAVVCRVVPERLRTLDTASAEAVLAVAQRAMNVLSAVQDLALAACVRREELDLADLDGDWADGSEYRPSSVKIVASSVAPILRSTPRGAESRVSDALCLVEDLPRTLASALDGRLTPRQTGVLVDRAGLVAVDGRPAFDAVVVEGGGVESLTPARLRRECERAAMAIDPAAVHRRSEHGLRDRFVRVEPGLDPGTTWWKASLPARDSMQAWGAVDELAHEYVRADPARSIDQARADAFLDLLLGSAQVSTTVELVVPTFTDPAMDDQRSAPAPRSWPCCPRHSLAQTLPPPCRWLTCVPAPRLVSRVRRMAPTCRHRSTPVPTTWDSSRVPGSRRSTRSGPSSSSARDDGDRRTSASDIHGSAGCSRRCWQRFCPTLMSCCA